MKTVTNGNNVKLHYKGTFTDGEVFDDSRTRGETMAVLVGEGRVLPGFENALIGMTEGQTKTVSLGADEAYGQSNPQAITTLQKDVFPPDYEFVPGQRVQGNSANGQPILAKIVSFTDTDVTLDLNHPLAGRDINFEIELVEIEEIIDTPE